ncbi:SH3 domain-containing protein [Chryseobacterium polytrichastri]|nr:SH3 domain-containing protein [Chryseobacterium polytrichastri]
MEELISAPYNIVNEGDGKKFNYDSLSTHIITQGLKSLQQFNYKFPEKEVFNSRIKDVFSIDVTKYKNDIVALRISDFPEIAIKNQNYILIQDSDSDNEFYINQNILYYYNKYIFNKDNLSLNLLKMQAPYLIKDLVVHYGYNKDKDLMKFVFKDFPFDNAISFHDLIFSKGINNQFILRKGVLDDIENIVYEGKTQELMSEAKEGTGYSSLGDILEMIMKKPNEYFESEQSIAFLCEKSLNIADLGTVQSFLHKYLTIKNKLEKNNYYNFERLKLFTENLSIFDKDTNNTVSKSFIIQDPDGYTNLRKDKNASSEILQKIKSGESIDVLENQGDWWLVKTNEGKQGYVHKSRVKAN